MGAPSDQFLHLLWRPPYVLFSYYMGAPRIISLHTILGPPDHFLRLLYGAPQICFFSYNMGAPLRSVSLFTIRDLPPPPPLQISFFACYRGATSHLGFFHKIYGGPLRSVSPLTIWGPLRSVSVHTFWGPLSDQFFLLLYGAPLRSFFSLTIWSPSDQFLRILYGRGGALRSVSLPTIWGSPEISFFAYYMRAPLRSVCSLTI